ncbi:Glycogen debranching enzyme [Wickerhamiella sorbophila]|uniref:Glycogen debranching enzyme n=1 Tax=Wickerhamiella sorbophila TaxID=45607 RepID=A0A2T0FFP3_9ASCO|nr:Glycogen debranching enzyme [Wickerhamiella sorbophila]PRT53794.1 Glycogen debranching enzyme [Wickerhamiella sorbophila]
MQQPSPLHHPGHRAFKTLRVAAESHFLFSTMRVYELQLFDGCPVKIAGKITALPVPSEPYLLRLKVSSTSPVVQNGKLYCNYPARGSEFDRNNYNKYELSESHGMNADHSIDIEIHQSGTFSAYIEYDHYEGRYGEQKVVSKKTKPFDFVVATIFTLQDKQVSPNELCVQSVLSKLMGPLPQWPDKLAKIAAKGYNMIHFVPLQQRGESNSPFSIYDQLAWDSEVFPNGESDVEKLVHQMEQDHGILALSDMVLNHTANNSPWLKDHPEAGYSYKTAPHLEAAVVLDDALLDFSKALGESGALINNEADLDGIIAQFDDKVFGPAKLWEYYVVDVNSLEKTVDDSPFQGRPRNNIPGDLKSLAQLLLNEGGVHKGEFGPRFHRRVETSLLAELVAGSSFSARQILDEVNLPLYAEYNSDIAHMKQQIRDRQVYLRIAGHGPKLGNEVNAKLPIIETYFTRVETAEGTVALANNGWVWGGNPLVDFAGPESKAYLRREVIIWGDCVKMRYGKSPEDNPWLWDHMSKYAKMLAKHFAGIRLDNCHSTPIHVGEYMLDMARRVRPQLYVVAELFSGSAEMDTLFVERLAINSLLREAIGPGDAKELSTVIQINGGRPIGSYLEGSPLQDGVIQLRPESIHAWLMEATHDNPMFAQKRTVEDTLSTAALVAFCMVASGSTMGVDEIYPRELNVVSEHRPYVFDGGISQIKGVLNQLHKKMGSENYYESFTHHDGQYITVHRLNPELGKGYYMVARTAFPGVNYDQQLPPVILEQSHVQFKHGWSIKRTSEIGEEKEEKIIPVDVEITELKGWNFDQAENGNTTLYPPSSLDFPCGSVAIFETTRTFDSQRIEQSVRKCHRAAVAELDLFDLSVLLYRCDSEERAATDGKFGAYCIPGDTTLVYAGLQGWASVLQKAVRENDLGCPAAQNLRDGLWALDSFDNRLEFYKNNGFERLGRVQDWLRPRRELISEVSSFLRPRYFSAIILGLFEAAVDRAAELMPDSVTSTKFSRSLASTSLQMLNALPNASVLPDKTVPSLAAGLPHFSNGFMRCWGRDVFLSAGGLLLQTGRLDSAKEHILGFAKTLKHGLIPNLLDSGRNPRYNARDAVWFFAQFIQEYCEYVGNVDILHEKVKRRFPLDDTFVEWDSEEAFTHESTIGEIVTEILCRHAKSIKFREHNAGVAIDSQMKDNGFNQHIYVDWSNGLVFGGNQDNCGTWMDKMGESELAGNKGVPGTPRDGAAIEIIGLLKSCLRWVNHVRREGKYNFPEGVENQDGEHVSLEKWEDLIQNSFEKCFYIPKADNEGDYDFDASIVNRRGIYKDLYRSGKPYEDYQLRPNFAIAMVAAPELFEVEHAVSALATADEVLRGPVGMATLDPSDYNYRPYYENSVENTDFASSKGRNYHQGPEWVWCFGMFLHAIAVIDKKRDVAKSETIATIRSRLKGNSSWVRHSPWAGLTELTQKDGAFCADSSPTQAWSSARLIEVFAFLA